MKLYDPPNHINEFLTHWTGRGKDEKEAFEILSKIIDTGELKFSPIEINFPNSGYTNSVPTVCFTDTPIQQSLQHCKRYNYFGISFNKTELIGYGANPVLYVVDNRQAHQAFLANFSANFIAKNEPKNLLGWFSTMLQPYNTNKFGDWPEFYEREWRIVRMLPYPWIKTMEDAQGPYNEFSYKNLIKGVPIDDPHDFYLAFDKEIIENIIVPQNYEAEAENLRKRNNLNFKIIPIEK